MGAINSNKKIQKELEEYEFEKEIDEFVQKSSIINKSMNNSESKILSNYFQ